jgi:outer membrane autotransporter protein
VTGTIDFAADGTISVADGVDITGAITNTTTNEGTLTLSGTTTVSGAVGSTGAGLKAINAGATGKTSTFSSAVKTTLLTTTGTGDIALNNAFTGNLNFASGAGATVTIANGFDFTGAMTNAITNEGTLTLSGTTTVSGAVGSTGAGLQAINAGTGTATFSSDVKTTLLSTNGSGNIALNGNFTGVLNITTGNSTTITLADGKNFTGTITNATTNEGILNVAGTSTFSDDVGSTGVGLNAVNIQGSGKTATFSSDLKATTITIANLATLKFTKAATTVTGSLTTAGTSGTIDVGTATVTASGSVTFGASSTLGVTIGDTNGQLDASATGATLSAGTTIVPTVSGTLTSGTAIVILKDNDGNIGTAVGNIVITDNNSLYNFTLALNGNNLELTPTAVATNLSSNATAVNSVVDAAFASDSTLSAALNGLSGSSGQEAALESLAPVVNGGPIAGTVLAGGAALNTVSYRIASLRTGISAGQGLSSGDEVDEGKNFWLQGFGTYADQNEREGIQGFDSVTGGFSLGADKQIRNVFLVGVAGSYSHTDVNTSLSENRTSVNSYQGTVYGSYDFGKNHIDAQFGLAYNDYEGERFISVGTVHRIADAGYDGYQTLTRLEFGRDFFLANKLALTPGMGLSWTHIEIDNYTETGAGTSNLIVDSQDYDVLNLYFRGELHRTWDISKGSLTPEIHLGYNYEAIDDKIQTVSAFTGGGNTFQVTGFDPANHSAIGGAGLTYSGNNFDFIATYNFEAKEDFVSHSALLKGSWKF